MIRAIADTHAVIWYIYDDARLSTTAKIAMQDAAAKGDQIGISAISLAETVYLVEKGRVAPATLDRLLTALDQPDSVLIEIAVDRLVVWAMRSVDRASIPDFPDRIIAATAVRLGIPLISRDGKIQASGVTTIW